MWYFTQVFDDLRQQKNQQLVLERHIQSLYDWLYLGLHQIWDPYDHLFFIPRTPKDWMANHPANGRMIAFFWDLNSNQWIRFLWDVMSWFDSRSFERYIVQCIDLSLSCGWLGNGRVWKKSGLYRNDPKYDNSPTMAQMICICLRLPISSKHCRI